MAKRRRRRSIWKPGAIGHVVKGIPYHVGNSLRGLRSMKRWGKKRADRDLQMTKDGIIIVCHWPRPLAKDGFVDPLHRIPRNALVSQHTWAEWKRCYTRVGHYRMNTLARDFEECGRLGITALVEPKGDRRFRDQAVWDYIARSAKQHGCKVMGYTLRANADCLPYMHAAGIQAWRLGK